MSDTCPICQHPKRQAIEQAMVREGVTRYLPGRFGVRKLDLAQHILCNPSLVDTPSDAIVPDTTARQFSGREVSESTRLALTPSEEQSIVGTEHPLSLFKQAWYRAKDDERMRQQMITFIMEEVNWDDLGL